MLKLRSIARLSQRLFDGIYKNVFAHAALYLRARKIIFLLSYFLVKFVDFTDEDKMNKSNEN